MYSWVYLCRSNSIVQIVRANRYIPKLEFKLNCALIPNQDFLLLLLSVLGNRLKIRAFSKNTCSSL